MKIWKLPYTLRRFTQQRKRRGYVTSGYTDTMVELNVQPIGTSSEVTAEGKRCPKKIRSFGTFPIHTDNVETNTQADRLFFKGAWYQCVSSNLWEHTPLFHYECEFELVSEAVSPSVLQPPSESATEGGDTE